MTGFQNVVNKPTCTSTTSAWSTKPLHCAVGRVTAWPSVRAAAPGAFRAASWQHRHTAQGTAGGTRALQGHTCHPPPLPDASLTGVCLR